MGGEKEVFYKGAGGSTLVIGQSESGERERERESRHSRGWPRESVRDVTRRGVSEGLLFPNVKTTRVGPHGWGPTGGPSPSASRHSSLW